MTEQVHGSDDESGYEGSAYEDSGDPTSDDQVRTGVVEVDGVLADVDGLADAPLDEHVAVFERAHDTLRGALDGRSETAPDAPA